jgi:Zn-dependent oligopeptidase
MIATQEKGSVSASRMILDAMLKAVAKRGVGFDADHIPLTIALFSTVIEQKTQSAELLAFANWAVAQLQGDSGAGHNYWEQFPEYKAGLLAIEKAEGAS